VSAPSSATTAVVPQTATTAVASPTTTTAAAPPASSEQPVPAAFTESTLATGSQYEVAVNNLVDMGFPRDQVVAAMRAAFNNPDRAADYLMTVI
jgi:UV excision repair protein RAD23